VSAAAAGQSAAVSRRQHTPGRTSTASTPALTACTTSAAVSTSASTTASWAVVSTTTLGRRDSMATTSPTTGFWQHRLSPTFYWLLRFTQRYHHDAIS
jgi:hypothetical protein